ncbi:hypothetical protein Peur_065542 [Populus x canadensis]
MTDAQERFRNIRLQEEYDTHDPKGHCTMVLPFLRKRSKIIEIVAARDMVFALAQSGVCAAFSRETNQRICFLNVTPDEVIRSLFYNKNNDSLITVSVYASDNFSSLKCRSTRIEYIQRGQPDAGFALFESESLKWPGFVEFDDVNSKVLTYSAQDSPGIMLLILTKSGGCVPLEILSIEDGNVLKSFNHLLHRNKKVDFIEHFNEKLLVKQENENLQKGDFIEQFNEKLLVKQENENLQILDRFASSLEYPRQKKVFERSGTFIGMTLTYSNIVLIKYFEDAFPTMR